MKIVFATNNKNKLKEIREILGSDFEILSLSDIGCHEEIPETGDTIEANARQKASYIADHYDHDSEANMAKLLRRLGDSNDRDARFRTCISLMQKGQDGQYHEVQFEGEVRGHIAREKHGTEGFGYDPLFVPEGYDKSFAELGEDVKNQISHRARAVAKLAAYLKG